MIKKRLLLGSMMLLLLGGGALALSLLGPWRKAHSPLPETGEASDAAVRKFCSQCHLFPPPDSLPRAQWAAKVRHMYEIAQGDAEKAFSAFPPLDAAILFYTRSAPEKLRSVQTTVKRGPGPLRLRPHPLKVGGLPPYPGVANIQFVHLRDDERPELLISEMRTGMILAVGAINSAPGARLLARLRHPCHAEVTDLDRDGIRDVLVADLGTPTPSDVTEGSIVWLRGDAGGDFLPVTLAGGLGRVADVQAADFDGDGDVDLVAAVFGWRKVGQILLLENRTRDYSAPSFEQHVVDARPGSIHVPVADLNGDGRPDFVALISQQFETVVAFINRGGAIFEPHTIFTAEHPNWGSNGIEVVDLDRDGDLDVLFVNGDSLDDLVVKPYHGIQWLENRGGFPFAYHRLTDLYGVSSARAGDLDGDGDLDIAACAYLPYLRADEPQAQKAESIIWLEQTSPGRFERWSLESVTCSHPTLDVGDGDGDGDLDIVVGNMTMAKRQEDTIADWVVLLENQLRADGGSENR